jgi:hypothetical protein
VTHRRSMVAVGAVAAAFAVPFSLPLAKAQDNAPIQVTLRFESRVADVSTEALTQSGLATLNDPRGWKRAGFAFVDDPTATYTLVLAEGPEVDRLCLPLRTGSRVSCQNGPIVALNADRYRGAVQHWDRSIEDYRHYLFNHEVGHLLGQVHPDGRCPEQGGLSALMEQQTGGLAGCQANPWPLAWEIELAQQRPVVWAPLPGWQPNPRPRNQGGANQTVPTLPDVVAGVEAVPATVQTVPAPSVTESTTAPSASLSEETTPATATTIVAATSGSEVERASSPTESEPDSGSGWPRLPLLLVGAAAITTLFVLRRVGRRRVLEESAISQMAPVQSTSVRLTVPESFIAPSDAAATERPLATGTVPFAQAGDGDIVRVTECPDGYLAVVVRGSSSDPSRLSRSVDRAITAAMSTEGASDRCASAVTDLQQRGDLDAWAVVSTEPSGLSFACDGSFDVIAEWHDGRLRRAPNTGDPAYVDAAEVSVLLVVSASIGRSVFRNAREESSLSIQSIQQAMERESIDSVSALIFHPKVRAVSVAKEST